MVDAIDNDKPLPAISFIETMKMLTLTWDDVSPTIEKIASKWLLFLIRKKMKTPPIHFLP